MTAGDQITFTLDVLNTSNTWYSQSSLNSDGANHVYSAAYGGSGTTPAGTYVGFEDLAAPHADFNYTDEQFVVTDVSASPSPVPLPSSNWLMLSALAGCVFFIRRRVLT